MENRLSTKSLRKKNKNTESDLNINLLGAGLGFYSEKITQIDFKKSNNSNSAESVLDFMPSSLALDDKDMAYEQCLESLDKEEKTSPQLSYNHFVPTEIANKIEQTKSALSTAEEDFKNIKEEKTSIEKKDSLFIKSFHFKTVFSSSIDLLLSALFFFPPVFFFIYLSQLDAILILKNTAFTIAIAYLFFYQMYVLLLRTFCLETFGESLARIHLLKKDGNPPTNPSPFFGRFVLSCLTGVIFLPLLSVICRKDLIAHLTRLYFFRK